MNAAVWQRLFTLVLMVIVVALGAAGQMSLKVALNRALGGSAIGGVGDYVKAFSQPLMWLGMICYASNFVLYLFVVSRARLGLVYPLIATNYAIVTFLAWRFLGEQVSGRQLFGLSVIILGVIIFATQPEPDQPAPPAPVRAAG